MIYKLLQLHILIVVQYGLRFKIFIIIGLNKWFLDDNRYGGNIRLLEMGAIKMSYDDVFVIVNT